MLENSSKRQPWKRSPREGPFSCTASAEWSRACGAVLGKLCPCCLVAIVNLRNNHCRVFWVWRFFYPFVSGFAVAASYLFLQFGLVVFQGFLLFFLRFLCNCESELVEGMGWSPGAGKSAASGLGKFSFSVCRDLNWGFVMCFGL